MPGIWQRLGGFGTKVIESALQIGRSLGETLRIIKPVAPEIEPMAAARDWGHVQTSDALEPAITALRPDEFVPRDLFVTSEIPWKDKYAYQVTVYGRDLITGRFTRQKFDMTVNTEMSVQGVIDETKSRFGSQGASPILEVFDVAVTGAWKSPEIEW